jgi:orotate phosphoribosyltransferase
LGNVVTYLQEKVSSQPELASSLENINKYRENYGI